MARSSWRSEISGPRSGSSTPGAIFTAANASATRAVTSSNRVFSTSSREPAEQLWPAFCSSPLTIAGIAFSRSASSKTRFGDLPPSSSSIGTSRRAHASATFAPVAAEPTNVTWSTPGWRTSASPVLPSPVATWNIPAGTPAS